MIYEEVTYLSLKIPFLKIANITQKLVPINLQILVEEKIISLLQSCKSRKHFHQIQTQIITQGLYHNEYITPRIVSSCSQFKIMGVARQLFDKITNPNIMLFNSMFKGYAQNECYNGVIDLFCQMNNKNVRPNCYTFPMVFKSCLKVKAFRESEIVYCLVIKSGFKSNPFVGTSLIDLYSSNGDIDSAYKVFVEMSERNVIAWTSMISGYILVGDLGSARGLFDLAPERDVVLWNIMISGYIEAKDMVSARKLFDKIPKRDIMSWNTILNGYANNADIATCNKLFEEMPDRNIFSWNALIGGYARNGFFLEVMDAFKRMLSDSNVIPNDATLVTVLSSCARLGALDLGKWVHIYADSIGLKENVYIGNSLIDLYAKCGIIETAMEVFKIMKYKDLISWNTIIGGLAMHGRGADALDLYLLMKKSGEKPDGITFISIFCACTHMGLVEEGFLYFRSMIDDYLIEPQIEHYGCIVDLLARAGLLNQAIDFVKDMPIEADTVIWATLLGACRVYKNLDLAELALKHLTELEPKSPSNYVGLSNIYGDAGKWKDAARLKVAIRDTGFRKLPGCSSIEVEFNVVEFYSFDERHPKTDEIYDALVGLTMLLRSYGYVPDLLELGHFNKACTEDKVLH